MRKVALLLFSIGCLATSQSLVNEAWGAKRPYRYVPLNGAIPEGFQFFEPVSIDDRRHVYGTLYACGPETCSPSVAVYHRGEIAVLHEGFATTGNHRGRVGGGVELDPALGTTQAALFTESAVKLLPPLSNDEFTSAVRRLSNSRIALVESFDADFNRSLYLTKRGDVTPLDVGPDPAEQFDLNDRGRISGTSFRQDGHRAFRYNPSTGRLTPLDPLPTEPDSWGQAINRGGAVLGYSFVPGGLERIGVWRGTRFQTYFVEGTPDFPTVSNRLDWNERGLIVITDTTDLNSYLVPRPDQRLNLADLTRGTLPPWTLIIDINENGDLIGVGGEERFVFSTMFLLRRVGRLPSGAGAADSVAASAPQSAVLAAVPRPRHPPALQQILYDRLIGRFGKDRARRSPHLRRS